MRKRLAAAIAALESGPLTPELHQSLLDLCRDLDVELGTDRVTLEGVSARAEVWPDPLRTRLCGPLVGRQPNRKAWFAAAVAHQLVTHHAMKPMRACEQAATWYAAAAKKPGQAGEDIPEAFDTIRVKFHRLRNGESPPEPIDAEQVRLCALSIVASEQSENK